MRITAFTKYGRRAASTRQRLLQYLPSLNEAGIYVDCRTLLDDDYVESLATGKSYSKFRVGAAYLKRMRELIWGPVGDVIWIYAELFPFLPAWFERLALRRGRPIVYDFDDAFFHSYDDSPKAIIRRLLRGKLEPLLGGASACTPGNAYLQDYASRFCRNSIILPTVVDTSLYKPRRGDGPGEGPAVIGWIGSPSTWAYMRPLLPMLEEYCRAGKARLLVIGAGAGAERDRFPGLELREWSEEGEVRDVQAMDIGIMPVPEDRWARGKSGYKLIQYMACGIPVVASPVGVNRDIVRIGENGFLADDMHQWRTALLQLLDDAPLRERLGSSGRRMIEEQYSLTVHAPRLVEILREAARKSDVAVSG